MIRVRDIDHVVLRVAELDKAIAFYRDVLGCAVELRQYIILFVQFPLYELVPEGLLRALHILKTAPTR